MIKSLTCSFFLAATATSSFAQQSSFTPPSDAARKLDSLFHYLDTTGLYNGNILVGINGRKFASAAIGYGNLATEEQLTEDATFELASVSKQFTAVGVLKLVDKKKLSLDQQLETIFPTLPYKGITIRMLLNHTSGLPDYMQLMGTKWNHNKIANNNDMMATLIKEHPEANFLPGTKWEYSNTGYALLASVIEKISGKSYADYMQQEVFTPLGMKHSFIYTRRYAPKQVKGYAFGYVPDEAGSYKLPDSIQAYDYVRYLDGISGDGTVNTTTGDMLIWNNAVHDGKLLSAALWDEALRADTVDGKSTNYGFGWSVTQHPERGKVVSHTGGWPGYNTNNVLYLDKQVSLIYLGNMELPRELSRATYDAVKNIVFGLPEKFPVMAEEKVAITIDTGIQQQYTGVYESSEAPGFELAITTSGGILYAQATGQGQLEILPESPTKFFVDGAPIAIEFVVTGNEKAGSLILHQNGQHEFKRK